MNDENQCEKQKRRIYNLKKKNKMLHTKTAIEIAEHHTPREI